MLANLITSKTRLRLLVKFFINAANEGYLRGLATEMHENTNAIRKELNNLADAGYILREEQESKIIYRANKKHPFFSLLQQIVRKHIGLDDIIEAVVERIGEVNRVFLVGDYTKGIDSGTIEVVIEGDRVDQFYLEQLKPKIENEINKAIIFQITNRFEGDGLLVFEQE
ncbi:ArsR family transcriptional regulator [Flavobacterium sp.]|uniref:ArsR family transcriptional regulator n=1 Tax=Flavobacterium sp. TaxID=239 RepID=UPI0033407EC8